MSFYDYLVVVTAFIALVGVPPLLFESNLPRPIAWMTSFLVAVVCVRNLVGVYS